MNKSLRLSAGVLLVVVIGCAACVAAGVPAASYDSNGDSIYGWHWLRDVGLSHKASWTFEGIAEGAESVVLHITCLATDTVNGGRGFPAVFRIAYHFSEAEAVGDLSEPQEITLPNVSPPGDVVGYSCLGTTAITRTAPELSMSTLTVFVERIVPDGPHVAFREGSIVVYAGEPEVIVRRGYVVKMRQHWCTRSEGPLYLLQTEDVSSGLAGFYRLECGAAFPWQDDPILAAWANADVQVSGRLSVSEGALFPVLVVDAITAADMFQRCTP